jgi:hypothetical protein
VTGQTQANCFGMEKMGVERAVGVVIQKKLIADYQSVYQ